MHARQCARFRGVDVANYGMSMWAGEQAAIKHVAQFDIVHEGGFACDQLNGINFAFGFADDAQIGGDASTG